MDAMARVIPVQECSTIQFSQRWHSDSKWLDGLSSSSVRNCQARATSVDGELGSRFWGETMNRRLDVSGRDWLRPSLVTITARSKTKKKKQAPPEIPQRELLSQIRSAKHSAWTQRMQELSQKDSKVERVWPFWRNKTKEQLEERALTKLVMELSRNHRLDKVFSLLEEARKERTISIILMNAVMAACVHCHDINRAMAVYQEMLQPDNCGVDNITYGILLKGLGQARRLDDAFALLESIEAGTAPGNPQLSEIHLNSLVNACVEAGGPLRARGVLLRYRSSVQGPRAPIISYNMLIKGYARSENPLDALKLKEEMRVLELQPQRQTYNSWIFACLRGGDLKKAFELLTEMKEDADRLNTSNLLPDVVTYTTLLKGLADDRDKVGVSNLISEMKSSPICVLDRVAYTAIIDAFIVVGCSEEGLKVWQEMKEKSKLDSHFKPRAHVYLALMRAFAVKGDMKTVTILRQQMVPESGGKVCPEDRAQADELMIESAVNAGQLGLAKQLLKAMVGIKKGIPLSNRAHMVVVRLQALLGFSHDLFEPYLLKPWISPQDTVESIMLPYEQAKPLVGDLQLKDVAMRFFKADAVPVIDEHGACVGVVHAEDCYQMDVRLCDIMKGRPPEVTNSTLVARAVSLLLQPNVKMVVVVSSRTSYSANQSFSSEIPLGFITRETIFSEKNYLLPNSGSVDQQMKDNSFSQTQNQ